MKDDLQMICKSLGSGVAQREGKERERKSQDSLNHKCHKVNIKMNSQDHIFISELEKSQENN